jgi:hypothetical protein
MSNVTMKLKCEPSAETSKQTFETAMTQVQHGGQSTNPSQIPIAIRKRLKVRGDQATEKRALTDAARALARLWNVSPALVR